MNATKLKLVWEEEHCNLDIITPPCLFEGTLVVHVTKEQIYEMINNALVIDIFNAAK